MKSTKLYLSALILIMIGSLLAAIPLSYATDDIRKSARALLILSGLEVQLSQIPDAITNGFDVSLAAGDLDGEFPPDILPTVRAGLIEAFEPTDLQQIVIETLAVELQPDEIDAIIKWYSTPLGVEIATTEKERSLLTNYAERDQFFRHLKAAPPTSGRLTLLENLENSWAVTAASVDMMIDMQVAVTAAVVSLLPEESQVPLSVLIDTYDAQREELEAHYGAETIISMLYIYNTLADEEIRRYTEFMETPLGQRYATATNLALHKAMLDGSYRLGQQIGELIDSGTEQHTL